MPATCPLSKAEIDHPNIETPFIGSLTLQYLLFYFSGSCSILVIILYSNLALRHLTCYVKLREQRQILRIGLYPVVFSVLSTFSTLYYPNSIYLQPIKHLYEPIALAAVFLLFVEFAEPDTGRREVYFGQLEHIMQKGSVRRRNKRLGIVPGGSLRWYQSKYVALYFYFISSIIIRLIEIVTQATGRYCQTSFNPAFAHIWVMIISPFVVPIGVLAILQFYLRMCHEAHFHTHAPTAKLLSFKAVLLVNFFQQIVFEVIIASRLFTGTPSMTKRDFQIGIPNLLICVEQLFVLVWFQWSYSASEYRTHVNLTNASKMNYFHAVISALDPRDLLCGFIYACKLLLNGVGPKGNGSWKRSGGYGEVVELKGRDGVYLQDQRLGDDTINHERGNFTVITVLHDYVSEEGVGGKLKALSQPPTAVSPAASSVRSAYANSHHGHGVEDLEARLVPSYLPTST